MADSFNNKKFDVEHALSMYADSFVTMPAHSIYEGSQIGPLLDQIRSCHIYLIGMTPKIDFVDAVEDGQDLVTSLVVRKKRYDLRWEMPSGASLKGNGSGGWYLQHSSGKKYFPSEMAIGRELVSRFNAVDFKVLYIGQAFGRDGSRHALDRLKKHETLQKIALKGVPDGHFLTILMLSIKPSNQLITVFNPWAKDKSQGSKRIVSGLEKLFCTSEVERTTLYEASLIRYFKPQFNIDFKNSFPSTNMKVLRDCYAKDFSAIIAEINIDELPYLLFSDVVAPKLCHIAKHDLHTDENRRVFFA